MQEIEDEIDREFSFGATESHKQRRKPIVNDDGFIEPLTMPDSMSGKISSELGESHKTPDPARIVTIRDIQSLCEESFVI